MSPMCIKCNVAYHPDYCVVIDEATNVCKCVWCHTGKKDVTISDGNEANDYKVTQKEAAENYRRYLKDLKDNPKIRKILMKEGSKPV